MKYNVINSFNLKYNEFIICNYPSNQLILKNPTSTENKIIEIYLNITNITIFTENADIKFTIKNPSSINILKLYYYNNIWNDKIDKVNVNVKIYGMCFQGGGDKAFTHALASINAIVNKKQQLIDDFLAKFKYLSGNSAGSWILGSLLGYKNTNGDFPIDKISSLNIEDLLNFYDKYWLDIVREHINKINIKHELEEDFLQKIKNIDYDMINKIFNLNFNKDEFDKIFNRTEWIEFLKYFDFLLTFNVKYTWNYGVRNLFLYPVVKYFEHLKMKDIILCDLISKDVPKVISFSASVLFDSYCRYGIPKSNKYDINSYPSEFDLKSEFITYK